MSPLKNTPPNLVRDWFREKYSRWKKYLEEKIKEGKEMKILDEEITAKTINTVDKETLL